MRAQLKELTQRFESLASTPATETLIVEQQENPINPKLEAMCSGYQSSVLYLTNLLTQQSLVVKRIEEEAEAVQQAKIAEEMRKVELT